MTNTYTNVLSYLCIAIGIFGLVRVCDLNYRWYVRRKWSGINPFMHRLQPFSIDEYILANNAIATREHFIVCE
jgi:hypothetical protein